MTVKRTIRQLLGLAACLEQSDTPLLDCQLMLAHVTGKSRSWLISHDDLIPENCVHFKFEEMVRRRQTGEPVAYILGYKDFWRSRLSINSATLIPRPETELLVELALKALPDGACKVVDLGTGSGAIAISLALEQPDWQLFANDFCAASLRVAHKNATGIDNLFLFRGHWTEAIATHSMDMVVCNPPYVRANDPHLDALQAEPPGALVSGDSGLHDVQLVIKGTRRIIKSGGILILEHGFDQRDAVHDLLRDQGCVAIEMFDDLNRLPRAIKATFQ